MLMSLSLVLLQIISWISLIISNLSYNDVIDERYSLAINSTQNIIISNTTNNKLINNSNDEKNRIMCIARKYPHIPMDKRHLKALIDLSYMYDVDPDLVLAIIYVESNFNPNAKNKYSSASGYGQLIKSTAVSISKKITDIKNYNHQRDAFDPYINLHITIYYINNCLKCSGGNIIGALKLYRGINDKQYFNKVIQKRNSIKASKVIAN